MHWPCIDDPADDRLRAFTGLRERSRWAGEVVVEGELAIGRALRSGHRVRCVVATRSHLERLGPWISARTGCYEADREVLAAVTGFDFHRGALALVERPTLAVDRVIAQLGAQGRSTTLALDRLADPANVGAAIRCARAFGVDLVIADRRGADPWCRRAIKASAGYVFELPVVVGLEDGIDRVREGLGAEVWAATVSERARALPVSGRPSHLVVVVGNEGDGVSGETLERADSEVKVPMGEGVDSLNVGAAAAVVLWCVR